MVEELSESLEVVLVVAMPLQVWRGEVCGLWELAGAAENSESRNSRRFTAIWVSLRAEYCSTRAKGGYGGGSRCRSHRVSDIPL